MSTTLNDSFWLERITQCRSSGLTDRQWCIENGIPVSTFYYHVRALRKKACEIPETADTSRQKQEVVQIPFWEEGQRVPDGISVFCQVLFPEKSVGIPFFQQGIFPAFSGHYASLRMRACSIR